MASKDKFIVTSPVAEFGYAHLRTPDTKFNPEGDYKLDFFLSPEDAKAFVERIEKDPRAVVNGKKAKVKATKVDGLIKFKSKQHAVVKNKKGETFDVKPRLFYIVDGKTTPYPETAAAPFAGSRGEVEVEVVPFEGFGGGLTLRVRAVRLHEVVEGATSGAAGDWDEIPEGFTSGVKEAPVKEGNEFANDEDGDDEDSEELDERW